jgi:hypothetical protein
VVSQHEKAVYSTNSLGCSVGCPSVEPTEEIVIPVKVLLPGRAKMEERIGVDSAGRRESGPEVRLGEVSRGLKTEEARTSTSLARRRVGAMPSRAPGSAVLDARHCHMRTIVIDIVRTDNTLSPSHFIPPWLPPHVIGTEVAKIQSPAASRYHCATSTKLPAGWRASQHSLACSETSPVCAGPVAQMLDKTFQ